MDWVPAWMLTLACCIHLDEASTNRTLCHHTSSQTVAVRTISTHSHERTHAQREREREREIGAPVLAAKVKVVRPMVVHVSVELRITPAQMESVRTILIDMLFITWGAAYPWLTGMLLRKVSRTRPRKFAAPINSCCSTPAGSTKAVETGHRRRWGERTVYTTPSQSEVRVWNVRPIHHMQPKAALRHVNSCIRARAKKNINQGLGTNQKERSFPSTAPVTHVPATVEAPTLDGESVVRVTPRWNHWPRAANRTADPHTAFPPLPQP